MILLLFKFKCSWFSNLVITNNRWDLKMHVHVILLQVRFLKKKKNHQCRWQTIYHTYSKQHSIFTFCSPCSGIPQCFLWPHDNLNILLMSAVTRADTQQNACFWKYGLEDAQVELTHMHFLVETQRRSSRGWNVRVCLYLFIPIPHHILPFAKSYSQKFTFCHSQLMSLEL